MMTVTFATCLIAVSAYFGAVFVIVWRAAAQAIEIKNADVREATR
jgi:hypothetical protein